MTTHCEICGRQAVVSALTSALTGEEGEGCVTCAMANAEPLSAVYAASSSDARWHAIPLGIRKAATVFDTGEYIPIHKWARRALASALVVVQAAPDDADEAEDEFLNGLLDKMEKVSRRNDDLAMVRVEGPSWLERVTAWAGEHVRIFRAIAAAKMGAWRVA